MFKQIKGCLLGQPLIIYLAERVYYSVLVIGICLFTP